MKSYADLNNTGLYVRFTPLEVLDLLLFIDDPNQYITSLTVIDFYSKLSDFGGQRNWEAWFRRQTEFNIKGWDRP